MNKKIGGYKMSKIRHIRIDDDAHQLAKIEAVKRGINLSAYLSLLIKGKILC